MRGFYAMPAWVMISSLPCDGRTWRKIANGLELSPQQKRIVELILHGKSDKEITVELGLSYSTVRTYLERIFVRVGVADRVELVLRIFTLYCQTKSD